MSRVAVSVAVAVAVAVAGSSSIVTRCRSIIPSSGAIISTHDITVFSPSIAGVSTAGIRVLCGPVFWGIPSPIVTRIQPRILAGIHARGRRPAPRDEHSQHNRQDPPDSSLFHAPIVTAPGGNCPCPQPSAWAIQAFTKFLRENSPPVSSAMARSLARPVLKTAFWIFRREAPWWCI
jgi:hypothetical protein